MHLIANWMVVQLFDDPSEETSCPANIATSASTPTTPSVGGDGSNGYPMMPPSSTSSSSSHSNNTRGNQKYDIQLNDLNNGNMYKYRFETLELAKLWYEKLKAATTYHERHKPDNLIRFD